MICAVELQSEFGVPRAMCGATSARTDEPIWDVSEAIPGDGLKPSAVSKPFTLAFQVSHIHIAGAGDAVEYEYQCLCAAMNKYHNYFPSFQDFTAAPFTDGDVRGTYFQYGPGFGSETFVFTHPLEICATPSGGSARKQCKRPQPARRPFASNSDTSAGGKA